MTILTLMAGFLIALGSTLLGMSAFQTLGVMFLYVGFLLGVFTFWATLRGH